MMNFSEVEWTRYSGADSCSFTYSISECIFALALVSINCVKSLFEYKIAPPQVDF